MLVTTCRIDQAQRISQLENMSITQLVILLVIKSPDAVLLPQVCMCVCVSHAVTIGWLG